MWLGSYFSEPVDDIGLKFFAGGIPSFGLLENVDAFFYVRKVDGISSSFLKNMEFVLKFFEKG